MKRVVVLSGLIACVVLLAPPRPLHAQSREQIDKLKSAFVLNFIRFTTWPDDRFAEPQSPIIITVIGDAGLTPFLRQIVRNERVNNRRIEVRQVAYPPESDTEEGRRRMRAFVQSLRASHAVFVSNDEADRVRDVLAFLRGADVLTISDAAGFAQAGGMLELKRRRDRIVFDANVNAIKATRITVSSKVLQLAENVIGGRN